MEPAPRSERPGAPPRVVAVRGLLAGAVVLALGLGVAGTASRELGGALVIGGWAIALIALHRLGRAARADAG